MSKAETTESEIMKYSTRICAKCHERKKISEFPWAEANICKVCSKKAE